MKSKKSILSVHRLNRIFFGVKPTRRVLFSLQTTFIMGLLKHFVFPVLILLHTNVVLNGMGMLGDPDAGRLTMVKQFQWEGAEDRTELELWEKHCLGIIVGGHCGFLIAELWSLFYDSAHTRGLVAVMELTWWAYGAYDAQRLGFPCEVAYGISALLLVALIVHSKEPGIFTKDKDAEKAKKK